MSRKRRTKELQHEHIEQEKFYRKVEAKTEGQQRYIDAIKNNSIVLAKGPAGCGKSYIAVGLAVEALRRGHVDKIVLSRPLVEACGEEVGLLPGTILDKVNPYMQHLYEALESFGSPTEIKGWLETEIVQVIPCAFLRGRTLKNAFVIIDESQNLTFDQIKLILTRIGPETSLILNADIKQTDLPLHKAGAFEDYIEILEGLPFVGICSMGKKDIVRSPYIAQIIDRIEAWEEEVNNPAKGY